MLRDNTWTQNSKNTISGFTTQKTIPHTFASNECID